MENIPEEIIGYILSHLNVPDILRCRRVATKWDSSFHNWVFRLTVDNSCKTHVDFELLKSLSLCRKLKELDLSGCIRIKDATFYYLTRLSCLVTLKLNGCVGFSDRGMDVVSKLPLRSLSLRGCDNITDNGWQMVTRLAATLQSLDLTDVGIIDFSFMCHLTTLSNLTHLNLSGKQQLSELAFRSLSKLTRLRLLRLSGTFSFNICHISSLQELEVLDVSHQLLSRQNCDVLRNLRSLRCLNLIRSHVLPSQLSVLQHLHTLRSLSMKHCDALTDTVFEHMVKLSELQELSISGKGIIGSGLSYLTHLSMLTKLDLSPSPKFINNSALNLAALTSVKVLDLSNCWRLTHDSVYALIYLTCLEELSLHGLHSLTDDGVILLTKISTLTRLDLSHCWAITETSLACLYSTLTRLRVLQLSGCYNVKNLNGISRLSKLTTLTLAEVSNLSSSVLHELASLRNLQFLNLSYVFNIERRHLTVLNPYVEVFLEEKKQDTTEP